MKGIILGLFFTVFFIAARSQEIGFNTTDIGGEFQWYNKGTIFNLQLALNAKIHHSFLIRAGYNNTNLQRTTTHDSEEGGGFGGGLGYRYYFKPFPHKFFIGTRVDLWKMDITWSKPLMEGTTKLWTMQPALEAGYTVVINDNFFFTPYIAAGTQVNLKTEGEKVGSGEGFIFLPGISAGIRF